MQLLLSTVKLVIANALGGMKQDRFRLTKERSADSEQEKTISRKTFEVEVRSGFFKDQLGYWENEAGRRDARRVERDSAPVTPALTLAQLIFHPYKYFREPLSIRF